MITGGHSLDASSRSFQPGDDRGTGLELAALAINDFVFDVLSSFRAKRDALAGLGGAGLEDLAPAFHDQFVALQINQLDFLQLKLIDAALARMDGEDYGVCMDCGGPISGRRLEAIPWANRCIDCQELASQVHDFAQDDERAA